ncbi:MAG: (2Fe-2S)-binding protein [Dehalococcoidia bacterium]|nr:(2Fe-2S)-binding protein [Dehalococcoidia bacterium]
MPEEKQSGHISRREFLKDAGLIVGGATVGSIALVNACSDKTVTVPGATATVTTTVAGSGSSPSDVVTLKVNGKDRKVQIKPNWTLAYVLREKLGLTGTKRGCDHGDCGVCTIIMDERPALSCLVLAVEAEGKAITTVEGLSLGGNLDPLQEAFINNDSLQCGFCTPGQIMTAKALLSYKANPTVDEIKEFMAGTLCRCGAHPNIVKAIQAVAR